MKRGRGKVLENERLRTTWDGQVGSASINEEDGEKKEKKRYMIKYSIVVTSIADQKYSSSISSSVFTRTPSN